MLLSVHSNNIFQYMPSFNKNKIFDADGGNRVVVYKTPCYYLIEHTFIAFISVP